MGKSEGRSLLDYFEDLTDLRIDRSKRHQLLDIIAIASCAVICGADSWVYVELFRQEQRGVVPNLSGNASRHPLPRHLEQGSWTD